MTTSPGSLTRSNLTSNSKRALNSPRADAQRQIKYHKLKYIESAGCLSMPKDNKLRLFQYFLTESRLDEAADGVKLAALYGSLGVEADRIVSYYTDATTNFARTILRLAEWFGEVNL